MRIGDSYRCCMSRLLFGPGGRQKRNVPERMPLAFGPGRLRSGDESEDRPGTFRLQPAVYGPVIRPELLCGPVSPVAVLYDNVRRL